MFRLLALKRPRQMAILEEIRVISDGTAPMRQQSSSGFRGFVRTDVNIVRDIRGGMYAQCDSAYQHEIDVAACKCDDRLFYVNHQSSFAFDRFGDSPKLIKSIHRLLEFLQTLLWRQPEVFDH